MTRKGCICDSKLCCVACGAAFPSWDTEDLEEARKDWRARSQKKREKPSIISSSKLEQANFEVDPGLWQQFYQTILKDTETNSLCISGISMGQQVFYTYPVPMDPQKACIWNAKCQVVNMLGSDWYEEKEGLIGYPVHAHCWLLLNRIIGHTVIAQNLGELIQAIKGLWRAKSENWEIQLDHCLVKSRCWQPGVLWPREQPAADVLLRPIQPSEYTSLDPQSEEDEVEDVWHKPGSPLRIPGIDNLLERVTRVPPSHPDPSKSSAGSAFDCLSLELILIIVDMVYANRPRCRARIEDTRNMLEVFQWKLPNGYWKRQCNIELLFEVQDVLRQGGSIDWAGLVLGLDELCLDVAWCCASGLNNRFRTLRLIESIKKEFLGCLSRKSSHRVTGDCP